MDKKKVGVMMARVKKILILVACAAILAVIIFQLSPFSLMQPKEIPNTAGTGVQQPLSRVNTFLNSAQSSRILQEVQLSLRATPATWFGLVTSLTGTLLFWMSVMWISKRRRS